MPNDQMTLKQARNEFCGKPSYNTLLRWKNAGVLAVDGRRVFLETRREGGRIYVSPDAVAKFKQRLNRKKT